MQTAVFESINESQLATTTDRLLAFGRPTKRNGPHVARRCVTPVALEAFEKTMYVTPLRTPTRKPSLATRLIVVAALVLVAGVVMRIHSAQAASSIVTAR